MLKTVIAMLHLSVFSYEKNMLTGSLLYLFAGCVSAGFAALTGEDREEQNIVFVVNAAPLSLQLRKNRRESYFQRVYIFTASFISKGFHSFCYVY